MTATLLCCDFLLFGQFNWRLRPVWRCVQGLIAMFHCEEFLQTKYFLSQISYSYPWLHTSQIFDRTFFLKKSQFWIMHTVTFCVLMNKNRPCKNSVRLFLLLSREHEFVYIFSCLFTICNWIANYGMLNRKSLIM